jgi:nucleoside-diphosphate-sugar epimerase
MVDLASEVIAMTNSTSRIVFQQLPSDDPLTREPDSSKAKQILNWEPTISRKVGLGRTIEYFKNELNGQSNGE